MHPLKSLNVMGDGGMIGTNDDKIANWLRKYRNHGMINRQIRDVGVNARMQPLPVIVANIQLKEVNKIIKTFKNANYLDNQLCNIEGIKIPERLKGHKETFALYMATFKKRINLKIFN